MMKRRAGHKKANEWNVFARKNAYKFNCGQVEKISVAVHDQALNMESSSGILEDIRGWQGMKCFGHCLQLCINIGLSNYAIEHLTRAASKLVGHFKHRVVDNEALKKDKNKWNNPSINAVQHDGTRLSKCWKNWLKQDSLFQQYYPVSKLLRKKDTYLDLKTWPMDTCWGTC